MKKVLLSMCLVIAFANAETRGVIADDWGDTFSDAKEVTLNTKVTGALESSGDVDFFKFTLDEDDGVIIDAKSLTDFNYPYLVLYNENHEEIFKEMIGTAREEHMAFNLSKGTYYIKIYDYDDGVLSYYFKLQRNGESATKPALHDETVEYCRTHLKECGIYVKDSLSIYDIDTIQDDNWHLMGTTKPASISILKDVKYAAIYKNGEWQFYSPDQEKRDKIIAAGYKIFETIPYNSGVWVKK